MSASILKEKADNSLKTRAKHVSHVGKKELRRGRKEAT